MSVTTPCTIASAACAANSIDVGLTAVPETMLWTLHNRVSECRRGEDGFLHDPKAIEIYEQIDYNFVQMFGHGEFSHALRSYLFDEAIINFWKEQDPSDDNNNVIVNLAEGLETQRFRLEEYQSAAGEASFNTTWITVDLPSAIEAREHFISPDEFHVHVAVSALDVDVWANHIPDDNNLPMVITAQGFLMYLEEDQVKQLFQDIAVHFPGSTLIFDTIPKAFSEHTMIAGWKKTRDYSTPPMPFGVDRLDGASLFQSWVEGLQVQQIKWPFHKLKGVKRLLAHASLPGTVYRVKFPAANY